MPYSFCELRPTLAVAWPVLSLGSVRFRKTALARQLASWGRFADAVLLHFAPCSPDERSDTVSGPRASGDRYIHGVNGVTPPSLRLAFAGCSGSARGERRHSRFFRRPREREPLPGAPGRRLECSSHPAAAI